MKKRIRIQIIGDEINRIRYPLNRAGIYTESLLQGGNPLGFVSLNDDTEETFPCTITAIDNTAIQLTLKKNLDAFLSHDPDKFCANIMKNGMGKTVRYRNTSSYLIVSNTNLTYPLLSYKGRIYTDTGSLVLSEYLRQNGAEDINPCLLFSVLRGHFDRYIDILQKEYDSGHIILVKSCPSPWYLEDRTIKPLDEKTQALRKLIAEADQYFIQRTGCVVVDTFAGAVPDGMTQSALPCTVYPKYAIDELAEEIIGKIHGIEKSRHAGICQNLGMEPCTTQELYEWETYLKEEEEFLHFLLQKSKKRLHLTGEDVRYIMRYVEQGVMNLHTVLGLFSLADLFPDKHTLKEIAGCLFYNKNCIAVIRSFARYEKNRVFLDSYSYFRGNIPQIEELHSIFLKVNNQYILEISLEQDEPFRLILFVNKETADDKQVVDDGYRCDIHEAEALCGNLKFYVQRAKNGNGNKPVELQYETQEEFLRSLFILDYSYLLKNEPFLIGFRRAEIKEFTARTDLSFLFQKKTRCVRITGGLADQIAEYVTGSCIQHMGGDVFYDDLTLRSVNAAHLGYELDKVLTENIDNKCFTHILSDALLKFFDGKEWSLADELFESGVDHLIGVANIDVFGSIFKKVPVVFYKSKGDNIVFWLQGLEPLLPWYNWCPGWYEILNNFPFQPDRLFRFLPFDGEDDRNFRLLKEMESIPAIGIHIRRGDFQEFLGETNQKYYRETLREVLNIPEYSKAKIYVFSDDILWCRKNAAGFGLTPDICREVTFIDFNKGEDSFRDMQLLSFCRVIISQQGGFSRVAYFISNRSEMLVTPYEDLLILLKKIGRGNKYELHQDDLQKCIDPWKMMSKQRKEEEERRKKERENYREYAKYLTLRIDIRNKGDKDNNIIEQSVSPAPVSVRRPGWLPDGITIEAVSGRMTVVLQCRGNGSLEIGLLGRDVRNTYGKRYPIWIDCTYFAVNGETVFSDTRTVCHDKRYVYRKTVTDGEIVTFDVAWSECRSSTILDEYKQLQTDLKKTNGNVIAVEDALKNANGRIKRLEQMKAESEKKLGEVNKRT